MPRAHRLDAAGLLHHVTSRGNRRQIVFAEDRDHRVFLSMLGTVAQKHDWNVFAYCLIPNHFHLMVETLRPTLSIGMQSLKGSYARYFNDVRGFDGHLFQGRFHSEVIENDWHLFEAGRYLALNPVRARLTSTPEAWEWSSYAATIGVVPAPWFLRVSELLSHYGSDRATAAARFSQFVREGLRE